MQTRKTVPDSGNVIICALIAILIVSLIGANVLSNSTTRLNVSSNQVRGWKEALEAAEAGGEMAFGELRKQISTDAGVRGSQWTGWTTSGTTHTSPQTTFGNSNLITQTTVETFYFDGAGVFHLGANPDPNQNNWYRVRSKGTSPLPNLKRTGMDDALIQDGQKHFAALGSTQMQDIVARGKGDSLCAKSTFNTIISSRPTDRMATGSTKRWSPQPEPLDFTADRTDRDWRSYPIFCTRRLRPMAFSMDLARLPTLIATIPATARTIPP